MEFPSFGSLQLYLLPAAAAAFLLFRHLRYRKVKSELPRLIKEGAIFVDVRTPAEFAAGARPGSLNIPLDSLAKRAVELDNGKTIILSCASGARSGMAAGLLKQRGFLKVINAGSWRNTL